MRIAAGFMNEIPVTGKYHREWQNDILNSFPRTFFVVSQYFANFSAGVSHHSLHSVWPLSPWELIINYAPNGWHHLLLDLSLAQLPTKSIVPFTTIALVSVDSTCWSNLVTMLICGLDGFEFDHKFKASMMRGLICYWCIKSSQICLKHLRFLPWFRAYQ